MRKKLNWQINKRMSRSADRKLSLETLPRQLTFVPLNATAAFPSYSLPKSLSFRCDWLPVSVHNYWDRRIFFSRLSLTTTTAATWRIQRKNDLEVFRYSGGINLRAIAVEHRRWERGGREVWGDRRQHWIAHLKRDNIMQLSDPASQITRTSHRFC